MCGTGGRFWSKLINWELAQKEAYKVLRENVTFMENDRIFYPDMDKSFEVIKSGELLDRVESVVGELK